MEIKYWNRTDESGTTHTNNLMIRDIQAPNRDCRSSSTILACSAFTWSHVKKKTVSWPTICSSVWSTQFLHFWHQPVSPSCTISISTLTFRVVQDAPPLQLSYVPILPSPSVAQPHTAFDVPVPLGEDWNNKNIQRVWADTVDGSEIRRSPVDMVNIPLVLYIRGGCLGFLPSTSSNKAWLLDSLRKFPASICRSTSRRYSWSETVPNVFSFVTCSRISRSTGA